MSTFYNNYCKKHNTYFNTKGETKYWVPNFLLRENILKERRKQHILQNRLHTSWSKHTGSKKYHTLIANIKSSTINKSNN